MFRLGLSIVMAILVLIIAPFFSVALVIGGLTGQLKITTKGDKDNGSTPTSTSDPSA